MTEVIKRSVLRVKADRVRAKEEKEARKRDLKGINFILRRLKGLLKDKAEGIDLAGEQLEDIRQLAQKNRVYIREGKFDGATISSIAKAYGHYTGGLNHLLDTMRPPSPLRAGLGYVALKQALREVEKPPPEPAPPPCATLQKQHPDKCDDKGLPYWSKTKPRYEADKGEVLSMTNEAIMARAAEKRRVERPPKRPYVKTVRSEPSGVAGLDKASAGGGKP